MRIRVFAAVMLVLLVCVQTLNATKYRFIGDGTTLYNSDLVFYELNTYGDDLLHLKVNHPVQGTKLLYVTVNKQLDSVISESFDKVISIPVLHGEQYFRLPSLREKNNDMRYIRFYSPDNCTTTRSCPFSMTRYNIHNLNGIRKVESYELASLKQMFIEMTSHFSFKNKKGRKLPISISYQRETGECRSSALVHHSSMPTDIPVSTISLNSSSNTITVHAQSSSAPWMYLLKIKNGNCPAVVTLRPLKEEKYQLVIITSTTVALLVGFIVITIAVVTTRYLLLRIRNRKYTNNFKHMKLKLGFLQLLNNTHPSEDVEYYQYEIDPDTDRYSGMLGRIRQLAAYHQR